MDWPIATVLLGTLGTIAVGILKFVPQRSDSRPNVFAWATDMVDIQARLENLEKAHHTLRAELRADISQLQQFIQRTFG